MKISFNGRFLGTSYLEGIGLFTYQVIKYLVENLPENEYFILTDREIPYQFTSHVETHIIKPKARHPLSFYFWFQTGVKPFLKKNEIDLFISFDGFNVINSPCPTILVVHDVAYKRFPGHVPWYHRFYYQWFMPLFLRQATKIITVSHFSKSEILHFFNLPSHKIEVACNGVRDIFHQEENRKRENYIIALGAIQPRKNMKRLIKAYDQFRSNYTERVELKIIGRSAWQTAEVFEAWKESPFQNDITFTGYVSDEDLVKLLQKSKGLIYPSLYEGFGVPILEAFALDVPVVTSNLSSMKEIAGDGAILVDPYSIEEMANGIQKLFTLDFEKTKLLNNAKKRLQQYSWDICGRVFESEIQRLKK